MIPIQHLTLDPDPLLYVDPDHAPALFTHCSRIQCLILIHHCIPIHNCLRILIPIQHLMPDPDPSLYVDPDHDPALFTYPYSYPAFNA